MELEEATIRLDDLTVQVDKALAWCRMRNKAQMKEDTRMDEDVVVDIVRI